MTTAQDGGRLSALRTGRLYPSGNAPGNHFCKRLSQPLGQVCVNDITRSYVPLLNYVTLLNNFQLCWTVHHCNS